MTLHKSLLVDDIKKHFLPFAYNFRMIVPSINLLQYTPIYDKLTNPLLADRVIIVPTFAANLSQSLDRIELFLRDITADEVADHPGGNLPVPQLTVEAAILRPAVRDAVAGIDDCGEMVLREGFAVGPGLEQGLGFAGDDGDDVAEVEGVERSVDVVQQLQQFDECRGGQLEVLFLQERLHQLAADEFCCSGEVDRNALSLYHSKFALDVSARLLTVLAVIFFGVFVLLLRSHVVHAIVGVDCDNKRCLGKLGAVEWVVLCVWVCLGVVRQGDGSSRADGVGMVQYIIRWDLCVCLKFCFNIEGRSEQGEKLGEQGLSEQLAEQLHHLQLSFLRLFLLSQRQDAFLNGFVVMLQVGHLRGLGQVAQELANVDGVAFPLRLHLQNRELLRLHTIN